MNFSTRKTSCKSFYPVQEMIIKCCLPSIPDKLVDVIEDDDVDLLLQEVSLSRQELPFRSYMTSTGEPLDFSCIDMMRAVERVLL